MPYHPSQAHHSADPFAVDHDTASIKIAKAVYSGHMLTSHSHAIVREFACSDRKFFACAAGRPNNAPPLQEPFPSSVSESVDPPFSHPDLPFHMISVALVVVTTGSPVTDRGCGGLATAFANCFQKGLLTFVRNKFSTCPRLLTQHAILVWSR